MCGVLERVSHTQNPFSTPTLVEMFFDMMGEKKTISLFFKKQKEYPTGGGYFFRDKIKVGGGGGLTSTDSPREPVPTSSHHMGEGMNNVIESRGVRLTRFHSLKNVNVTRDSIHCKTRQ